MRNRAHLFLGVIAVGLSGCASMSGQECLVADWEAIGYEDGARGAGGDRIGQHRKACAKHGVAPELQAYQAGREAGLREFCQPENGYNLGLRGASYAGVCPAELDIAFFAAYSDGKRLHDLRTSLGRIDGQIRAKEQRLDDIEDELTAAGLRLISTESTAEERVQLLTQTKNLAEEHGRIESDLDSLREDRVRAKDALTEYEATLARL
jgi:hypothetical protein